MQFNGMSRVKITMLTASPRRKAMQALQALTFFAVYCIALYFHTTRYINAKRINSALCEDGAPAGLAEQCEASQD